MFKARYFLLVGTLSASLGLAGCAVTTPVLETSSATLAEWEYEGPEGPDAWGNLDAAYLMCLEGIAQSPINIVDATPSDLENIEFKYLPGEAGVFNNGHTVEAEPMIEGGGSIVLDDAEYPFLQFHFHAPSEHVVDGERYPVEAHFVHQTEGGEIAVVGVFIKEGPTNEAWAPFVNLIATATEDPEANLTELDWAALLPETQTTFRYDGSLTTPGCSEGVRWNVMTTPITMSSEQIAAFVGAYPNNSRPVQPLNGREVFVDSTN